MKFTEKLKAKKADEIENPAKETAKKEKKPLKQKIHQERFLQRCDQCSIYRNRSCSQYDRWFPSI